jgi:HEAT repeat protein
VLLDLLQAGQPQERRWRAAIKLGQAGDVSAVVPLLAIAENAGEAEGLRSAALEAAARLGDSRAAAAAARILQTYTPSPAFVHDPEADPTPALVCLACQVIAQLGGPDMAPMLLALLDDGNPHIRYAAVEALGAVADGTAIRRLQALQQSDDASIPVEEPQSLGGMHLAGMRLVALRAAAAEAVRRIRGRAGQS